MTNEFTFRALKILERAIQRIMLSVNMTNVAVDVLDILLFNAGDIFVSTFVAPATLQSLVLYLWLSN